MFHFQRERWKSERVKKCKNSFHMRSILITGIIMFTSSLVLSGNGGITCTFDDRMVTIANANTTLQIDNDFHFEIFYNKKGKIFPLTEKSKTHPSLFLCDSINEKILFSRKAVQLNKINDAYGNGEKVKIEAVSRDGMIKCFISFSCYNNWPEIFLVKASFLNISESNYFIRNLST